MWRPRSSTRTCCAAVPGESTRCVMRRTSNLTNLLVLFGRRIRCARAADFRIFQAPRRVTLSSIVRSDSTDRYTNS
jgi:hypothetical protein